MPISSLPRIMVAPTGARRTVADHVALPVTIPQIVAEARNCFAAGAGGIHAHVRDGAGQHSLDCGLYKELLAELALAVPDMVVQITTESVGMYGPQAQRNLVRDLRPAQVSIALREMIVDQDDKTLRRFYHWTVEAGIGVQHILYSPNEIRMMQDHIERGIIPADGIQLMLVLGQYQAARDSQPEDLDGYLNARQGAVAQSGWAVCAFGRNETACLVSAVHRGGKARIGLENNLHNADGSLAASNAARVAELVQALAASGAT